MSPKLLIFAAASTALGMPAAAQMSGRPLTAALRGNLEIPGPGKLDARGSANVRINPGMTRLCYMLTTRNLPQATMAHIHRGGAETALCLSALDRRHRRRFLRHRGRGGTGSWLHVDGGWRVCIRQFAIRHRAS